MNDASQHDSVFGSAMREMSRSQIAELWQRGKGGKPLSDEDSVFYTVMCDHPEYSEIWDGAAELADRKVEIGGTNPFLHVSLHVVLEGQMATNNPPEASQALFRLMKSGMNRHESLHKIASVLSELIWETLHRTKPFDEQLYRRRLRSLKPLRTV